MKKYLLLSALFISFTFNSSYKMAEDDQSLARVKKAQGKYVFYFNEPVQPYKEVFKFGYPNSTTVGCRTIDQRAEFNVNAALLEAGSQTLAFDAIIVGKGDKDIAIQFLNKEDGKDKSLARLTREKGKYVYIFADPAGDYDVVDDVKYSLAPGSSKMFGGSCYTTDQLQFEVLKKATGGKKQMDGIILGSSTASVIKFK